MLAREIRTLDEELAGTAAAPITRLPAREVHSPAAGGGGVPRGRPADPELRERAAALAVNDVVGWVHAPTRRTAQAPSGGSAHAPNPQLGRRALSDTTSSSASRTKFITTEEPP